MKFLKKHKFLILSSLIVALALISRFLFLGARPLHHDEGMLSYYAWKLAEGEGYTYSPQIHGPVLFYAQAFLFALLGSADVIAKLSPAIFGAVLVALPLLFHRWLGRRVALAMSLIFLTSPLFLYFSRFLVHTALVVAFWFLFLICLKRFVLRPTALLLYSMAVFLALAFGTSETTYIFLAALAAAVLAVALLPRVFPWFGWIDSGGKYWSPLIAYLKKGGLYDCIGAFLVFAFVWGALYSVAFSNIQSLATSLPNPFDKSTSLGFWLSQHPVRLGGQPWFYYLTLSFAYEFVIFLGAAFALFAAVFRKRPFLLFLSLLSVFLFVGFSWAGEKFPWLFLPPLLPMAMAAGCYLGESWARFKPFGKIVCVVLFAAAAAVALRLGFINHTDTRELAVYVQTPLAFQGKIDEMRERCLTESDPNCVLIDHGISWPLSWSLKESSILFFADNLVVRAETKYVIIGIDSRSKVDLGEGWREETVWLRDWWVPPPCRDVGCLSKYIGYFFTREIWGEKGGHDVVIFSRD